MKYYISFLLVLTCLFTATGQGEQGQKLTRRPVISIEDAIAKAKQYVREKKLDTSQQYMDSVVLELNPGGDRGKYWRITWERNEFIKGGQTFINVYMDGSVTHTYGE